MAMTVYRLVMKQCSSYTDISDTAECYSNFCTCRWHEEHDTSSPALEAWAFFSRTIERLSFAPAVTSNQASRSQQVAHGLQLHGSMSTAMPQTC